MSLLRLMSRDPSRVCPFYTRGAKCASGCWSEPHCVTGEPVGGWPWENLLRRARWIGKDPIPRRYYRP
jgi:hypothetical protein